jgi:hypothetical protein
MKTNAKSAKKMALMELIKHMNKKRFQDKAVDPKAALQVALKEGSPEEEAKESPEEEALEDPTGFEDYRKNYMKKGGEAKPTGGATIAIMIGAKPKSAAPAKGRKRRG